MNTLIKIIFILLLIPSSAFADTAASCSVADVTTAYNSTAAGGTVTIPAGSCTWASGITLSKAITLQGAGVGSTIITHNASGALITIAPTTATDFIRVTGIYFENTNYLGTTRTDINLSTNGTAFRIDNCTFHNGKEVIGMSLYTRHNGVIDNNTFLDVDLGVRVGDTADYYNASPSTSSWGRTIAPSTSDAVFIEDNTFTTTNRSGCEMLNESIYHHNGGRSVTRHNTFANTCAATVDTIIDAHGLAGCDRGTAISEIYENTFSCPTLGVWVKLRGGTFLMYNNTMTLSGSDTTTIRLSNEQAWAGYKDYGGSWPSMDQIYNSFFWNNTIYNSTSCVGGCAATISLYNDTLESPFIQENRDYFMHSPQATGGKETFGGQAGFANEQCSGNGTASLTWGGTTPVACCTGSGTGTCNMTFSSSGANAYYPYTPYEYPHPLRGESGSGSYVITIAKSGDGTGTVTEGDDHINCGSSCSYDYYHYDGQEVTFTATPATGMYFSGWTGGCVGAGLTCTTTISEDATITASFTNGRKCSLGAGGGTITVGP
jgi:hypothetical protein